MAVKLAVNCFQVRYAMICSRHCPFLCQYPAPCPAALIMQVLFVLSADRPLTESEVKFLQYVRQWGKKVVFVVNKVRLSGGRTGSGVAAAPAVCVLAGRWAGC